MQAAEAAADRAVRVQLLLLGDSITEALRAPLASFGGGSRGQVRGPVRAHLAYKTAH
jgi:hypothetical protein